MTSYGYSGEDKIYGMSRKQTKSVAESNKIVDEWVAERNSHIGEIRIPQLGEYPPILDNFYGSQLNEWVTTDLIRHYADALGDRNLLWRSQDYAKGTIWGGIIAPPTFTDSIGHHSPLKLEPEQWAKFNSYFQRPYAIKREMFQIIRPGDKFRLVDVYLGVKELETDEPKPSRKFINSTRRYFYNQREEVVAILEYPWCVYINRPEGSPPTTYKGWGRKRRRLTDEERDAIYRGYDEETRRGSNTLYWEDVVVGEEIKPLIVGPISIYDSAASFTATAGHAVGYDIEWERIKINRAFATFDDEVNAWKSGGEGHFCDGAGHSKFAGGGYAYAQTPSLFGLFGRAICNWMGDSGFLRKLYNEEKNVTILGDVYKVMGKVVNKHEETNEHLVALELHAENQDALLLTIGIATVRLPSRTKL
jgi:hypothetical protein